MFMREALEGGEDCLGTHEEIPILVKGQRLTIVTWGQRARGIAASGYGVR